jgi:hypothetical protein
MEAFDMLFPNLPNENQRQAQWKVPLLRWNGGTIHD